MSNPKVSVCLVTYNHEPYIAKAIESILEQKTDFKYEIIVGDDCSVDNTRNIVQKYIDKYPDIVRPLYPEKNTNCKQSIEIMLNAKGEYIALLEGDDYWCDENKLQKQTDFLDKNLDFSFCCHNYHCAYEKENFSQLHKYGEEYFVEEKYIEFREVTIHNIINPFIVKTLSAMIRTESFLKSGIATFGHNMYDIILFGLLLEKGKGAVLSDYMGVYQIRNSGNFSSLPDGDKYAVWTDLYYNLSKYYKHKVPFLRNWSKNEINRYALFLEQQDTVNDEILSKLQEMKEDLLTDV